MNKLKIPLPTVADYIIARLAKIGINECFGVPGDFSFILDNAVENNPDMQWIGCANELNAAYAADGYARIKGAALICTTYAVGELSALNGIMGSKAERLPVFHLVGMPSLRNQRLRRIVHHTLGDGVFQNFIALSEAACCVSAIITPHNCVQEMERVIATALLKKQPAYIVVAEDFATMSIVPAIPAEWPAFTSNADELAKAIKHINLELLAANTAIVLPAYTVARWNAQAALVRMIETLGVPFATLLMDKAVLSETHPQYLGQYIGSSSFPETLKVVEDAEVIIDAGGILLSDLNTLGFNYALDNNKMMTIGPDYVQIQQTIYHPVKMQEVFEGIAQSASKKFTFKKVSLPDEPQDAITNTSLSLSGESQDVITNASLYSRLQRFIQPNDIVIAEIGTACLGLADVTFPDKAVFYTQALWSSIGWATGAALGTAIADRKRRTILVTGEGSHQLTANEIGTFGRYQVKPVIFVINNSGYTIERALEEKSDWSYNDLAPWQYAKLPETLGCKDWISIKIRTNAELDAVLEKATGDKKAYYIEVMLDKMDLPPRLALLHSRLKQLYGS